MLDRELVFHTIHTLLGRPPVDEASLAAWCQRSSIAEVAAEICRMPEFAERMARRVGAAVPDNKPIRDSEYFSPKDLASGASPSENVLLIGSCFVEPWPYVFKAMYPDNSIEFMLVNNISQLPSKTPAEASNISFQIVNIPVRSVIPDRVILGLSARDSEQQRRVLSESQARLNFFLDSVLVYNRDFGIRTFVTNFIVPQFNTLGRLMPRYNGGSIQYLFEEMNRYLEEYIKQKKDCHLIDIDSLASAYGKRYILDDSINITSHGSFLTDFGYEQDCRRLEPPDRPSTLYSVRPLEFMQMVWSEIIAAQSVVRQQNTVKMVVTDLDDTLWRGIIGEMELDESAIEGWPIGYIEALLTLKKRGIVLALISKNDEATVRKRWEQIAGKTISLSDFAVLKINWNAKIDNMNDVLNDVNILPKNVIYVDDNPVERAAMRDAFPGMRVLGANPYTLKRILMLSPETQLPVITDESMKRTEMVQAQSRRNADMRAMSREEFLASLALHVSLKVVSSQVDQSFARAFELLNKTNQFNTTGRRWSSSEISEFLRSGGRLFCFDVTDTYTRYGLVGVLLVKNSAIEQFVMSCRVIGLDVETFVLHSIADEIFSTDTLPLSACIIETPFNSVSRDVFERAGFVQDDERWILEQGHVATQTSHVTIEWADVL